LHADRFLPLTPIRVVINHKLADVTEAFADTAWEQTLQAGSPAKLIDNAEISRRTLPAMFEKAGTLAETRATELRQAALHEMNRLLGHELERLQTLAKVNDHIRPEEIRLAQAQKEELDVVVAQSRLRLDSLRLIWKGPPAALE
jgi:ATP-dependent helicase HepA